MTIFDNLNLNLRGSQVSVFKGSYSIKKKKKDNRYTGYTQGSLPEPINRENKYTFASGLPQEACASLQFNTVIQCNVFLCNHRSFGKQSKKNEIFAENL